MKSYFSGLEEALARLVSAIVTILGFLIYVSAKGSIVIGWRETIVALAAFWVIHEIIGFLMYLFFRYFSNKSENVLVSPNTNQANNSQNTISENPKILDSEKIIVTNNQENESEPKPENSQDNKNI